MRVRCAVSAGITMFAVAATIAIAGRLYAASLLAGGKLTWRQAWHAEPIT
jgi:ABC-2 type transport system permease protein